jgi:hypothetical protein
MLETTFTTDQGVIRVTDVLHRLLVDLTVGGAAEGRCSRHEARDPRRCEAVMIP